MMPIKKTRKRSTQCQLRKLVDYMAMNPNFANGEHSGTSSDSYMQEWMDLRFDLNEHGPNKSVKQWRHTWRDLKKKARARFNKASHENPDDPNHELSEMSSAVLSIIRNEGEPLEGNLPPGVKESSSSPTGSLGPDGVAKRKALHADIICTHRTKLQLSRSGQFDAPKVYQPAHKKGTEICTECSGVIPASSPLSRCVQCAGLALLCARCVSAAHAHHTHALMQLPNTRTYHVLESIFEQLRLEVNDLLSKEEYEEDLEDDAEGHFELEIQEGPDSANVQLDEPLVLAPRPAPYLTLSDMKITQDLTCTSHFDPLHTIIKGEYPTNDSDEEAANSESSDGMPLALARSLLHTEKSDCTESEEEVKVTPTKRKARSERPSTSMQRNAAKGPQDPLEMSAVDMKQEPLPPDEEETQSEPDETITPTKRKAKSQRPGSGKKKNATKEAAVEGISKEGIKQEPLPPEEMETTDHPPEAILKVEPVIQPGELHKSG